MLSQSWLINIPSSLLARISLEIIPAPFLIFFRYIPQPGSFAAAYDCRTRMCSASSTYNPVPFTISKYVASIQVLLLWKLICIPYSSNPRSKQDCIYKSHISDAESTTMPEPDTLLSQLPSNDRLRIMAKYFVPSFTPSHLGSIMFLFIPFARRKDDVCQLQSYFPQPIMPSSI